MPGSMRRIILFLVSLCACLPLFAQFRSGSYSGIDDSEAVAAMKEHVSFLSSHALEGRKAGSEGEADAAAYVSQILSSYGLDILSGESGEIFGMKQESGDTLVSRNVVAYIPGYDKSLKDNYILIGARLDNLGTMKVSVNGESKEKFFPGANGNASGLAMLMELGRMLQTTSVLLKRSVIIAAFGSSLEMNAGSWYFLNRSFSDAKKIDAMVNLDMLGTASNGFYAYTSSNKDMNKVLADVSSNLLPIKPQIVSKEPVGSDHRSFYGMEIPSVMFTTGMYPEYNTDRDVASILEYEDMERELEYIYNCVLSLANGNKPSFRDEAPEARRSVFERDVIPYYECDYKPSFLGSIDPSTFLKKWVYVYLRYPEKAVEQGIQGRVLVDFTLDEKGKVTDVRVAKGVDPLLDDEAVRVISASPDWKPARLNGKKVKCGISLYVEFRLQKRKNR